MSSGDVALDFSDPAGSEERLRTALAAGGKSSRIGVLTTQLARMLGLQGRYDEAHAALSSLDADDPGVVVRVALERGRLHRSADEPDLAEPLFAQAATLAADAGLDGLRLDALHMLALLPDDVNERRRRHEVALQEAQASSDPDARRWIAPLLHNLGLVEHDADDLPAALSHFQAAVEVRSGQGNGDELRVARWMVAWTNRLIGHVDEALAEQHRLEHENRDAGTPDPFVHDELAELYLMRGDTLAAEQHRAEAERLRG